MKLKKCPKCDQYTFKQKCSECKVKTINPHPIFKKKESKNKNKQKN